MSTAVLGKRGAGLMHLSGQRDRTPDGEWGPIRCVLCEQVLPERHQGISSDCWVLISHAQSAGRPQFVLHLRDDIEHGMVLPMGSAGDYWRCDAPDVLVLSDLAPTVPA